MASIRLEAQAPPHPLRPGGWRLARGGGGGEPGAIESDPLCRGSTRSIRFAAVAFIRRPVHDGQKPRPLQLNATSRLSPQSSHFRRAKPRQSSPQPR